MSADRVRVRLVLAEGGEFMVQDVAVPTASLEPYDRLIDALREDPVILKELYVDYDRLCAAQLLGDAE